MEGRELVVGLRVSEQVAFLPQLLLEFPSVVDCDLEALGDITFSSSGCFWFVAPITATER